MNSKRQTLGSIGGGRHSFAPISNIKTPTRPRFTLNPQTPNAIRQSTSRFSMGGMTSANKRQSLFKAPNNTGIPKDTNDKAYQARVVKKIYNYLLSLDGEDAVSEAKIANPQTKDFITMFEQIFESVAPQYEYPRERKLQEEIPRIFSELGYNYQIKMSTLQTIGAAHSWHYLLHALSWLVDFVQKPEHINVGQQVLITGNEDDCQIKAFRLSWASVRYHEYQNNRSAVNCPDFIERATKAVKDFFENNENINGQISSTEDYLNQIKKEIEELKLQTGNEDKFRDDIRRTDDDIKKSVEYNDHLLSSLQNSLQEKEAVEAETKAIKSEVDALKEQVAQKKQQILEQEKSRGIKGDEAQVIMSEYNQLKHRIRESQSALEILSKEQWINQPKLNDTFAQISSQVRKIVGAIRDIGDAVNYTFQRYNEETIKNPKDLYNALRNDLHFEYQAITEAVSDAIRATEKEIKEVESDISHIENRVQMEEERLAEFQRRLQKKTLSVQQFADEAKMERRKESAHIEKLENEKEVLQRRLRGVGTLQQELENARNELEKTLSEAETRKNDYENRLKVDAQAAFEALKTIRKERNILGRHFLSRLSELNNV